MCISALGDAAIPPEKPSYTIKPYALVRRLIQDRRRVAALLEVAVTDARRILHAHKEATGEALSFTAFILACLGAAIDANSIHPPC